MSALAVAALMLLGAALLTTNANGQTSATGGLPGASADQQLQPGAGPAAAKPDSGEPAAVNPVSAQPVVPQPGPGQPGQPGPPAQPGPGEPGPQQAVSVQPAAAQPMSAEPVVDQPDAARLGPVRPDEPQPDAAQPDAVKPDAAQPDAPQPAMGQPAIGQPDSIGTAPAQGETREATGQASPSQSDASSPASDAAGAPASGQDPLAPLDDPAQPVDVPSVAAWQVIDWVIATRDNNAMPFLVVDKVAAEVFLFDPDGQRIGASPALVGMTAGDEATAWVGDRELSNIPPKDRTTPAGRFISNLGPAVGHRDVLWIDYPDAISLHAVISVRNQHRFERLRSPTPDDNRITYGCINVPAEFYAKAIKPMFKGRAGVVYILPDTKALNEVFLAMPQPLQQAAQPQARQDPPQPSPSAQSSH